MIAQIKRTRRKQSMTTRSKKGLKDNANTVGAFPSESTRNRLNLKFIKPKTINQNKAFKAWDENKHLLLTGTAGTGKTFIAMYMALKEVQKPASLYKKVIIVRSVLPTRDIGALPGDIEEKTSIYELPFYQICGELLEDEDAYNDLKDKKLISFLTTSFIRGISLRNAIVIFDEAQNCDLQEAVSVLTRVGENCRVIVCGDRAQADYMKGQKSGFDGITKVLSNMRSFEEAKFTPEDICRSDFLKEFYTVYDAVLGED